MTKSTFLNGERRYGDFEGAEVLGVLLHLLDQVALVRLDDLEAARTPEFRPSQIPGNIFPRTSGPRLIPCQIHNLCI